MTAYHEVKVRYDKRTEEAVKRVSEVYLVQALSVSDAEVIAVRVLNPYVATGDIELLSVSAAKYHELLLSKQGRFYRVRIDFISLNNDGREVRRKATALVIAEDVAEAAMIYSDWVKGQADDVRLLSVVESPIQSIL